ncbi:MAG: BREX-1 system adenine-specific DNA-methyltransferase PglX [Chloroflexota bacterium]|nr:BREX-1 system adenine-specific DNA-methyltransferase PglX [Chloroflexota bacterium]
MKVPFDLDHWQQVAAEKYPNGLPEPHSDDPTQWLFGGHSKGATDPLQVAVARLLGYRWPEQPAGDGLDGHADADGIVCLPAVRGERPAAERLRALLADAFGAEWSPALLESLLAGAGFAGRDLSAWLVDAKGFFHQHCRLFQNRPFVWHVWDGARDGFSALINYHKLTPQNLDKLIHTYLGDWIALKRQQRDADEPGAETGLARALELKAKLEAIQRGDPPFDIYVRWKPLHRQPVGWEPDLDDGVRLNARPFVTAGVLRAKFSVGWNKDRGDNPPASDVQRFAAEAQQAAAPFAAANPALGLPHPASTDGRERLNGLHLPRSAKEAARAAQAETMTGARGPS